MIISTRPRMCMHECDWNGHRVVQRHYGWNVVASACVRTRAARTQCSRQNWFAKLVRAHQRDAAPVQSKLCIEGTPAAPRSEGLTVLLASLVKGNGDL